MRRSKPLYIQIAQLLLMLLFVCGCADRIVREAVPTLEPAPEFTEAGTAHAPNQWWTAFGDSKLNYQIQNALANNFSLAAARQNVREARAVTRLEASDFWPDIDGILGIGSDFGPFENSETYSLGLDLNYQVDLWGEIQSRVEAERFRANAACWDFHATALALSAEITSVWFSLIEAHAQADLLKDQIKTNRTGLKLQEQRFGLGLIRSADVLRQRQLLESTLQQEVIIQSQIRVLEHQLAVLLGQTPQLAQYDPGMILPELPPLPQTGFSSELLLRRPDIQSNFNALLAADRDFASAISAQFPRLNLSASLTNISENPGELLRDWIGSVAGQLIAPLFDGGQRKAEVDRTNALKLLLFNEYAQSVLVAYQEVEDSLVQEKYQLQIIEHLEEQVKLSGQASNQLREQYLIGDAEYLDVLSSITGQQGLQRDLLGAQLELRLIRVSLYLALAGNIDPNQSHVGFIDSNMEPMPLDEVADTEIEETEPAESADPPEPLKPEEDLDIPDEVSPETLLDRLRGTNKDE